MTNFEKIKALHPKSVAIILFCKQTDVLLAYNKKENKIPFSIEEIEEWLESEVEENMLPEHCSCGYRFEADETICPNCGKKVEEDG